MFSDEILFGIAIGLVFDELGRRLIVRRAKTLLDVDGCVDVDGDGDGEDDTVDSGDNTSAHAKTVDYFDPDVDGGADDEDAP